MSTARASRQVAVPRVIRADPACPRTVCIHARHDVALTQRPARAPPAATGWPRPRSSRRAARLPAPPARGRETSPPARLRSSSRRWRLRCPWVPACSRPAADSTIGEPSERSARCCARPRCPSRRPPPCRRLPARAPIAATGGETSGWRPSHQPPRPRRHRPGWSETGRSERVRITPPPEIGVGRRRQEPPEAKREPGAVSCHLPRGGRKGLGAS
mmetsp:Transcript_11564/g.26546  ORF Transcript_11564/g.26546 Transcript_11564/m.26546 type:complete len:215 (-) Transcript_11564:602-1246(-)